jgi:hypothetical protein
MQNFDLAIAYKWEYDEEFVELIEHIFQSSGFTTFLIKTSNVNEVIELLETRKLSFKALLDRASDEDPEFMPISQILHRRKIFIINPQDKINQSIDKAAMHKNLLSKKFTLPLTFILPAFNQDFRLHILERDIDYLQRPFIIKPSFFSGGGEGVVTNATSLNQIQKERMRSPVEKYLVQEKIQPRKIKGRKAWFRIFWAFDRVIPTWWDDSTHIYFPITEREITNYKLQSLIKITKKLARITTLDYFSTEIAITKTHKFYLIDYINDQCDMRLKSNHPDGVPDTVVELFVRRMLAAVSKL